MDLVIGLPVSTNWKDKTYDSILDIIHKLTKIIYYKPIKVTIDTLALTEIIIEVVVQYHSLPDSIVSNQSSVFTSKFWSSLCYFLGIKQRLSTAFYPQTNNWIEK